MKADGLAIRARREAMGLAQIKLGPVAGVSHGTIRNVENGKPMEESTRRKIEAALGWYSDTTNPHLSAEDAASLAGVILALDGQARVIARATVHAFVAASASGEIGDGVRARMHALLCDHLPAARVASIMGEAEPPEPPDVLSTVSLTVATDGVIADRAITDRAIADRLDALAAAFPEDLFPDDERTPEAIRVIRLAYQHAARIARGEA